MTELKGLRLWSVNETKEVFKKALSVMIERSRKYASDESPFSNFESSAQFAGVSVEAGILTRVGDKFSRLRNTIDREEADGVYSDESFDDTIVDICNYMILLRNYRRYKRGDAEQDEHAGAAEFLLPEPEEEPQKPSYFQRVISALRD